MVINVITVLQDVMPCSTHTMYTTRQSNMTVPAVTSNITGSVLFTEMPADMLYDVLVSAHVQQWANLCTEMRN